MEPAALDGRHLGRQHCRSADRCDGIALGTEDLTAPGTLIDAFNSIRNMKTADDLVLAAKGQIREVLVQDAQKLVVSARMGSSMFARPTGPLAP